MEGRSILSLARDKLLLAFVIEHEVLFNQYEPGAFEAGNCCLIKFDQAIAGEFKTALILVLKGVVVNVSGILKAILEHQLILVFLLIAPLENQVWANFVLRRVNLG